MSGKQQARFQMLIDVGVQGTGELKKVNATAAKTAAIMKGLADKFDKMDASAAQAKGSMTTLKSSLDAYTKAYDKYSAVSKRIITLEHQKSALSKKQITELTRLKAAQVKETAALNKQRDVINSIVPGLVKFNAVTGQTRGQQKLLKSALTSVTLSINQIIPGVKKYDAAMKKNTKTQKKTKKAVKDTTHEIKKQKAEFNSLSQRINNSGKGFNKFRRILGSARNTILVLTFATAALRAAFKKTFAAANELEASLRGLGSVATNTGQGFTESREAAIKLSEKGLLSIQDAAAGLKNLLSAGFGLKEATKMMNTFTDAAAFNRQGTLSMGQAIVGATQGVKNQNSIMVDNAGITKNLSIMYKEFAESIGTTSGKLTEAQKRQAIFNGVQKEGAVFMGDAQTVIATMSGALTVLGTNSNLAAAEIGKMIQPIAGGFVQAFAEATEGVKNFAATLNNDKDREARQKFILWGSQIRATLDGLAGIFGALTGATGKYSSIVTGALSLLIKYTIASRAFNAVQNMGAKRLLAFNTMLATTGQRFNKNTRAVEIYNLETGKGVGILKTFSIILTKSNLRLKQQGYQIRQNALKSWSPLNIAITQVSTRVKALMLRMINLRKAMVLVGGAGKVMAAGFKVARIAAMALVKQLILFEALFWVLQKVTKMIGAFVDGGKTMAKQAKEQAAATGGLTKKLVALRGTYIAINDAAQDYENTMSKTAGLQEKYNAIATSLASIQALTEEYNTASSLDAQAKIRTEIEDETDKYDKLVSIYKEGQQKLQRAVEVHEAKIAAAHTGYNEDLANSQKVNGMEDYDETVTRYRNILQQIADFQSTRARITDKSHDKILAAEVALEKSRILSLQAVETEKQKLVSSSFDKLAAIKEKYDRAMVMADQSELDRVKAKYAQILKIQKENLKAQAEGFRSLLAGMSTSAKESLTLAAGLVGGAIPTPSADAPMDTTSSPNTSFKNITGVAAAVGPEDRNNFEMFKEIATSYENLSTIMGEYQKGIKDVSVGESEHFYQLITYEAALKDQKVALEGNLAALNKKGMGDSEAAGKIEATISTMKGEIKTIGDVKGAYKAYGKIIGDNAKTQKEFDKALGETSTAVDATIAQQTLAATAAVRYKEDLKALGQTYADLAVQFKGQVLYGDSYLEPAAMSGAYGLEIENRKKLNAIKKAGYTIDTHMTEGQRKLIAGMRAGGHTAKEYAGQFGELMSSMLVSRDTWHQQAVALRMLEQAQKGVMDQMGNKLGLAKAQLAAEQATAASYVDNDKYTKLERIAIDKRVIASKTKVEAIENEIAATKILNETEKQAMRDAQENDRFQEKVENMTGYAEKFSNFITTMQNLEAKRTASNRKYETGLQKEKEEGKINQEQMNQLMTANQKLTAAKMKQEETKFTSNLIREIGKQIMLYAAKKAAASGNIFAAMGYLTLGVAGMAVANNAANKLDASADAKYQAAQQAFDKREAEIRGEGDEDAAGSATGSQKFGGSIKAESLSVTISPTVVISGETVFIGQGSVTEFGAELQSLLLQGMNDAIENREIDISGVSNLNG